MIKDLGTKAGLQLSLNTEMNAMAKKRQQQFPLFFSQKNQVNKENLQNFTGRFI